MVDNYDSATRGARTEMRDVSRSNCGPAYDSLGLEYSVAATPRYCRGRIVVMCKDVLFSCYDGSTYSERLGLNRPSAL